MGGLTSTAYRVSTTYRQEREDQSQYMGDSYDTVTIELLSSGALCWRELLADKEVPYRTGASTVETPEARERLQIS